MLYKTTSFDQDLSSWEVGRVTNMKCMYNKSSIFNQTINPWDVGSVRSMNNML